MGNRSMSDGLQALYVLYTYPRQGKREACFVLESSTILCTMKEGDWELTFERLQKQYVG